MAEKKEAKTERLRTRLSLSEKKTIEEKASQSGLTITDYVIKKCVDDQTVLFNPKELIQELKETNKQLKRVGTNINQIANFMNFLKNSDRVETETIIKYIDNLEQHIANEYKLHSVLKKISKSISR